MASPVRNVPLRDFLKRSQVSSTSKLAWLHTTQAFEVIDVLQQNLLQRDRLRRRQDVDDKEVDDYIVQRCLKGTSCAAAGEIDGSTVRSVFKDYVQEMDENLTLLTRMDDRFETLGRTRFVTDPADLPRH